MAFGFKNYGDSGALQIDDTYKSLEFRQKGTLNISALTGAVWGSGIAWGTFTIDLTFPPVLAFRDTVGVTCCTGLSSTSLGGGVTRYTVALYVVYPGSTAYDITYYVYGPPRTTAESALPTVGMVVRDASGNITFRSDQKYFNVAGIVSLASPTGSVPGTITSTSTFSPGRTYAVVSSDRNTYARSTAGGSFIAEYASGFGISGATVTTAWEMYNLQIQEGYNDWPATARGLVVDVTNF